MDANLSIAIELLERAAELLADLYSDDNEFNNESWALSEEIQEFLVKIVE